MNGCQYYGNISSQYSKNILMILFVNKLKIKYEYDNFIKNKKIYEYKKTKKSIIVNFLKLKSQKTNTIKIMNVKIAKKNKSKVNNKS